MYQQVVRSSTSIMFDETCSVSRLFDPYHTSRDIISATFAFVKSSALNRFNGLLLTPKRASTAPIVMNLDARILHVLCAKATPTTTVKHIFERTAKAVPALNIH
jgi:hypothetical protein